MKNSCKPNAVIYSRVSTDEQKEQGFSLHDQNIRMEKYCNKESFNIVGHYQEDHSAKNFDRPEFQKFLKDVETKRIKVDIFICVKYDRFSRDLYESIKMLQKFKRLGIEFRTLESNYDLESPDQLLPFYIALLLPEVDNKIRSNNTIRGMRQGKREGRWMGTPPKGYFFKRCNNKSELRKTKDAKYIEKAFDLVLKGIHSTSVILRQLKDEGFECSNNQFYLILRNPVYAGKIRIPEYRDEPEELVDGIHEPIISWQKFKEVQKILSKNGKKFKREKYDDNLPLRNHLICPKCGRNLTGSGSLNRLKNVYHYYHCIPKCKTRFNANVLNKEFIKYLNKLKFSDEVIDLYIQILKNVFHENRSDQKNRAKRLRKEISNNSFHLDNTYKKYANDKIDNEAYSRLIKLYRDKKRELEDELSTLESERDDFNINIEKTSNLLNDLPGRFQKADIFGKHKILCSIFPNKMIYDGKKYRTRHLNEVISLLTRFNRDFQRQTNEKTARKSGLSYSAPPLGLEPRTL